MQFFGKPRRGNLFVSFFLFVQNARPGEGQMMKCKSLENQDEAFASSCLIPATPMIAIIACIHCKVLPVLTAATELEFAFQILNDVLKRPRRATGRGLNGQMQFLGKPRRGICLVLPHTIATPMDKGDSY